MPLEEVISGFTFTGFATTPPVIPGLQALGIYGSAKDGKNSNRVAGGPTFTNLATGTGPVINPAFGTFNTGTTAATAGFDLNVIETAAVQPGGWTEFVVARLPPAGPTAGNACLMTISTGQSLAMVINPTNTNVSSHPSVYIVGNGVTSNADSTLDLGAGNLLTNWKMFAVSFPGTAASPYMVRSLTDAMSKLTTTTYSRTGSAANHFTTGWQSAAGFTAVNYLPVDIAASGVAFGVLSDPVLASLRTWLQGVLGVRGITGF
jgi:hypothetical protein